jgi:hypothetical protein
MKKFSNETAFELSKDGNFTHLPNSIFESGELSFKAIGIYASILKFQNSPNHKIYLSGLAKLKADGKDSVASGIKELIKFGFLKREQLRNEKGQMQGYKYIVFDKPCKSMDSAENGFSENGKTDTKKQNEFLKNNKKNKNIKKQQLEQEKVVVADDFKKPTTTPKKASQKEQKQEKQTLARELKEKYKECFGKTATQAVERRILNWLRKFSVEAVLQAFEIAGGKGKGFEYANGVVANWRNNNCYDIDAIFEYDAEWQNSKAGALQDDFNAYNDFEDFCDYDYESALDLF